MPSEIKSKPEAISVDSPNSVSTETSREEDNACKCTAVCLFVCKCLFACKCSAVCLFVCMYVTWARLFVVCLNP